MSYSVGFEFAVEYQIYREVKVLLWCVLDIFKQALTRLLEIKGHTVPRRILLYGLLGMYNYSHCCGIRH